VSERLRWFLPSSPDVLGLLRNQADVTTRGLEAFARWSTTGSETDARAVRDAEHEGDDLRHEVLQALSSALTTPIEQEDAYALSERIDEVLDRAKDTVRVAQAFEWRPNEHTAAMGARIEEATRHLNDAVACLATKGEHPGDHAELAIKAARSVEHGLLEAFAALPRDGASWDRTAAIEVYRGYSDIEHALLRVADRTWYAVLRAM
jgi:uncharacterized protein Yka (UPF0111/DUF47 family)